MNELDIQVLKVKPAEIEFNHKEIMDELDGTLKRYKGVVHTEETTSVLRKDIATLRRAKKSINRFRIDRKNEMLEPITEFENKIKQIEQKVEEVEFPLSQQEKEFEEKRRADKLETVKKIRLKVFEDVGLEDMSVEVITIEDSYLAKTKTLTKIEEEMLQQANEIKQSVETKKANEEIIKLTVESANNTHDLNMSLSPYLSQLELYDVDSVKQTINSDVEKELNRIKELEEKKAADLERKIAAEAETRRLAEIEKEEAAELENYVYNVTETEEEQETDYIVEDVKFEEVDPTKNYVITFKANALERNHIIEFLESINIEWSDF